jgi:hypothetical protein
VGFGGTQLGGGVGCVSRLKREQDGGFWKKVQSCVSVCI